MSNLRNYQLSGVVSRSHGLCCEVCIRSIYSTLPPITERKTKLTKQWRKEHDYEINSLMHLTQDQYLDHILSVHRTKQQRQQRRQQHKKKNKKNNYSMAQSGRLLAYLKTCACLTGFPLYFRHRTEPSNTKIVVTNMRMFINSLQPSSAPLRVAFGSATRRHASQFS